MIRYECRTAQKGFAAGKALVVRSDGTEAYRPGNPAEEYARLEKAAAEMNRRLEAGKETGTPEQASVIDAEILILNGEEFLGTARCGVKEKQLTAPEAVRQAADRLCAMLEESGQEYIRQRCEDVRGLAKGLTALITGSLCDPPAEPCILAGSELSPGEITMIGAGKIRGILTETGSPTSHVSVLAGDLGIPYLYGLADIPGKVRSGDYLILDSGEDSIYVNPPEDAVREAEKKQAAAEKERAAQRARAAGRATKTKICANIGRPEEADGLAEAGADGIGLFRSEFLFLNRTEAPGEEEQFQVYRHAAEAMGGRETVIRTMDIGSDKRAAWLEMPEEINPALGTRGIRVSLAHRELFRTQLRALLRAAAYGNIRIMAPMIASVWEIEEVKKEIRTAAEELESRNEQYRIPDLGVMIETPAAAMTAPELAEKVRFFSIGTNDLTQYTLAADREARGMERYSDPMHEAVFRLIALAADAAHRQGITAAVCGELAGNPEAAERLIRLGIDELSVSPARLAEVRNLAADIEEKQAGRKKEGIRSPAAGELIPMAEIPDPVFAGGMMGECVGVMPDSGEIFAPVSGTVLSVAGTRHAVILRSVDGEEILVHAGLDTVKLNGEGFIVYVREGEKVEQGRLIMRADLDTVRARGFNPIVITVRVS